MTEVAFFRKYIHFVFYNIQKLLKLVKKKNLTNFSNVDIVKYKYNFWLEILSRSYSPPQISSCLLYAVLSNKAPNRIILFSSFIFIIHIFRYIFFVIWIFFKRCAILSNALATIQWVTPRKKGTKAVTGAVPFQKVSFCPF